MAPRADESEYSPRGPLIKRTLTKLYDLQDQIEALGESSLRTTLQNMTIAEAIHTLERLSQTSKPLQLVPQPVRALSTLSDREMEVVRLIADGLSNKEIATRMKLSDKTIKNHISHILAKMNLTARTQVAVYAIKAGIA